MRNIKTFDEHVIDTAVDKFTKDYAWLKREDNAYEKDIPVSFTFIENYLKLNNLHNYLRYGYITIDGIRIMHKWVYVNNTNYDFTVAKEMYKGFPLKWKGDRKAAEGFYHPLLI